MPPPLSRFAMLERHVRDLERSVAFYVDGLGFRRLGEAVAAGAIAGARPGVLLGLGDERIVLHAVPPGFDGPTVFAGPDVRFQHAAIVTPDIAAALRRLSERAPGPVVPITRGGPQRLPEASGGATAFKFRDPDGHPLELIEFAGAGLPGRWQGRADQGPTLGIDHFAISVSQVERSIAFYGHLGLSVGARQLNVGAAQARLDGLDGLDIGGTFEVEVDVVALMPSGPPGVHLELLGYRRPAPRVRPAPDAVAHACADRLLWVGLPATGTFDDPDGHRHGPATTMAT